MKPQSLLIFIIFIFSSLALSRSALTFNPGGNRLGDQLMAYIRGKYVAQAHNLDFFIPPFTYSDQLALSNHELPYDVSIKKNYRSYRKIIESQHIKNSQESILYESDFNINICGINSFDDFYFACKENTSFSTELKKLISPLVSIEELHFPAHAITVAVHVRKGGGFDAPLFTERKNQPSGGKAVFADKIWPTKFPPDDFYLDALRFLVSLHPSESLHVHIFTDARYPGELISRFRNALKKSSLTFSCREKDNSHDKHVLDDLFNMARCDYLIRPQSSYSRVAQLIGDHKIIISPLQAAWKNNTLVITKISKVMPRS